MGVGKRAKDGGGKEGRGKGGYEVLMKPVADSWGSSTSQGSSHRASIAAPLCSSSLTTLSWP